MQQVSLRVGLVVVGGLVTAALLGAHASEIWGGLVRVLTWYDNEWGFSNRMSDTAALFGSL